jgi:hypothetical protein
VCLGLGAESDERGVALLVFLLAHLVELDVVLGDVHWRGVEVHLLADEAEETLLPRRSLLVEDVARDGVRGRSLGVESA